MSLLTSASNPFRPADWRWQRAQAIADRSRDSMPPSRQRDGVESFKWITTAVRFLREFNNARTDVAKELLSVRRPGIFWAHHIWTQTSNPLRYSIEAQILARCDNHLIGYKCNVHPDVIANYEALFFNVREKLQHRSYILNVVMGPAVHQGLSERDYGLLWKLYGYFLGPHVVDALEGKFVNPVWCNSAAGVGAAIMDDSVATLKFKAALASKTVPVNQYTQLQILDAFTKFVEIERNTDSAGKAQDQILDHISAMMTTLPFSVGGRAAEKLVQRDVQPIEVFERTALELTFEETLRMSAYQPIAHKQILESLQFPALPAPTLSPTPQTREG